MDCALDLMRRLPPQQIEKNLSDLIDLVPSLCEELLSSVDQPLKIGSLHSLIGRRLAILKCFSQRQGSRKRLPSL